MKRYFFPFRHYGGFSLIGARCKKNGWGVERGRKTVKLEYGVANKDRAGFSYSCIRQSGGVYLPFRSKYGIKNTRAVERLFRGLIFSPILRAFGWQQYARRDFSCFFSLRGKYRKLFISRRYAGCDVP